MFGLFPTPVRRTFTLSGCQPAPTYPWPDPNRTPHECPVCHGRCTVPPGFYSGVESHPDIAQPSVTGCPQRETCRSCNGKGVIWAGG